MAGIETLETPVFEKMFKILKTVLPNPRSALNFAGSVDNKIILTATEEKITKFANVQLFGKKKKTQTFPD